MRQARHSKGRSAHNGPIGGPPPKGSPQFQARDHGALSRPAVVRRIQRTLMSFSRRENSWAMGISLAQRGRAATRQQQACGLGQCLTMASGARPWGAQFQAPAPLRQTPGPLTSAARPAAGAPGHAARDGVPAPAARGPSPRMTPGRIAQNDQDPGGARGLSAKRWPRFRPGQRGEGIAQEIQPQQATPAPAPVTRGGRVRDQWVKKDGSKTTPPAGIARHRVPASVCRSGKRLADSPHHMGAARRD